MVEAEIDQRAVLVLAGACQLTRDPATPAMHLSWSAGLLRGLVGLKPTARLGR